MLLLSIACFSFRYRTHFKIIFTIHKQNPCKSWRTKSAEKKTKPQVSTHTHKISGIYTERKPANKVTSPLLQRGWNWVWPCRQTFLIHSNVQHWVLSNPHTLECCYNQHALFSHKHTQRRGQTGFIMQNITGSEYDESSHATVSDMALR